MSIQLKTCFNEDNLVKIIKFILFQLNSKTETKQQQKNLQKMKYFSLVPAPISTRT